MGRRKPKAVPRWRDPDVRWGRDREKARGRKGRERGGGKKLRGTGEDEPPRYKECAAFKKGREKGRKVCPTKRTDWKVNYMRTISSLFYFIIYLFLLISFSTPADRRRNPSPRPASPFSVTGAFSPGFTVTVCVLGTVLASSSFNLPLASPVHSHALPSTAARISNGVSRCIFDPTSPFVISRLAPCRFSFCPGLPVPWARGKRVSAFSDNQLRALYDAPPHRGQLVGLDAYELVGKYTPCLFNGLPFSASPQLATNKQRLFGNSDENP